MKCRQLLKYYLNYLKLAIFEFVMKYSQNYEKKILSLLENYFETGAPVIILKNEWKSLLLFEVCSSLTMH